MDVGHDAAAGDGDRAQQAGELLVVADGQLDVARHDAGLLVVPRGVSGKLKNLCKVRTNSTISPNYI